MLFRAMLRKEHVVKVRLNNAIKSLLVINMQSVNLLKFTSIQYNTIQFSSVICSDGLGKEEGNGILNIG